jgi:hypothetical protein
MLGYLSRKNSLVKWTKMRCRLVVNDCRPASNLDFPHLKYSIKRIKTNKRKQLPFGEGTPRQNPKGS